MKDDTIKRSDAIKAILQKPAIHGSEGSWYHADDIRDALNAVPSADRPQGEWIVDMLNYKSVCSVCGANETDFIYGTEMWYGLGESRFCPNCGARMFAKDTNVPNKEGADDE